MLFVAQIVANSWIRMTQGLLIVLNLWRYSLSKHVYNSNNSFHIVIWRPWSQCFAYIGLPLSICCIWLWSQPCYHAYV